MPATRKNPVWTTLVMVLLLAGSSATAAKIDRPRSNVVFTSWFLRSRLDRQDRKRQNLGPSEDPHRDLDSHALFGE